MGKLSFYLVKSLAISTVSIMFFVVLAGLSFIVDKSFSNKDIDIAKESDIQSMGIVFL